MIPNLICLSKAYVMKNFLLFISVVFLAACNSGDQIEKCVQAGIDANGPYKTSQEKSETEFVLRRVCLDAASGKQK
jgi:hypothetical protein